jgi:hypothetical protein
MFTSDLILKKAQKEPKPKDGELYKVITAHGATFEIRYGYYEEADRQNPSIQPMEMYPNFLKNPVYADMGMPFVTAMQKTCPQFKGDQDEDNTCYQCGYYEKCEDLLGLCKNPLRKRKEKPSYNIEK